MSEGRVDQKQILNFVRPKSGYLYWYMLLPTHVLNYWPSTKSSRIPENLGMQLYWLLDHVEFQLAANDTPLHLTVWCHCLQNHPAIYSQE